MNIIPATKYTRVTRSQPSRRPGRLRQHVQARSGPNIKVKDPERVSFHEWWHREMKEGNSLHKYFDQVRKAAPKRWRKAAQHGAKFQQNNDSDARVVAKVPLNDFLRWRQVDPDFWSDNSNLKSLRRDNDDLRECIYV